TPLLFSVSYAGYWGQHRLGLPEFFHKAARLGYPAVEIAGKRPHLSPLDYPNDSSLEPIPKPAEVLGVKVVPTAGSTDFTAGRHVAEVPFVEMQVAYVSARARMGKALGAKIVRVFSGYSPDAERHQLDWDKCVTALRESASVAADYGLVLGLQNHHDVGVSVEAFEMLLDDVKHPNLKAMFDPWAPALHGADLRAAARRLAPRMVQTTLADYVKLPRFVYQPSLVNYEEQGPPAVRAVPLGEGFLDLGGFFDCLREG